MLKMAAEDQQLDVVFMDPPRSGSSEVFLDCLAKLAPKKVVYISCNPETLARDLRILKKKAIRCRRPGRLICFHFVIMLRRSVYYHVNKRFYRLL